MTPATARSERLYARPVRQLFAFVLALLVVVQTVLSLYAWALSEQRLLPELGRKAHTTGVELSAQIVRALGYGIPLRRLEGVPEYFADVLKDNHDLAYLRVTAPDGATLYESHGGAGAAGADGTDGAGGTPGRFLDTALPLQLEGATVGHLHVGVDQRYVAGRIRELRYDIAIVLVTSLLIAFEILWFIVTLNFTAPMRHIVTMMGRIAAGDFRRRPPPPPGAPIADYLHRLAEDANREYDALMDAADAQRREAPQRAAQAEPLLRRLTALYTFGATNEGDVVTHRIVLVRVLSFLFMFAEMLSRPFLPVYAASLPAQGLDSGLHASLPITAFLLGVALTMPFAGGWSDRLGRRSSYIAGALTVMAGLAVTGLVPDYMALVVARAVTGAGYAVMFMACQGYVFDHTDAGNRAKGMALFVGAIMVAEICAPAVGGILADRIGYRLVFLLGALVAMGAALLAALVLRGAQRGDFDAHTGAAAPAPPPGASLSLVARLARNRRFVALSILSGIPAKFMYSGFLIFLVPVLLSTLGHSKSEIGRYTMLYGLSSLVLAPLFAHLADRYNAYARLVAAGGVLTGLGMLPVHYGASGDMVMLGIAALGMGQSMSISAQLVLVARVTRKEARDAGTGPIVGLFRLLERLGAAAGPLVTGMLVARNGAPQAMLALGGFALACSLAFGLAFMAAGRNAPPDAEGAAA